MVKSLTFIVRFRPGITPSIMKPASPLFCLVVAFLASTSLFAQQFPTGESPSPDFFRTGNVQDPVLLAASCLSEQLHLDEVVRCHPASRYLELHFDLQDAQVEGVTLFEVLSDTTWIGNLALEPNGVLFLRSERMGETITLRQVGESACSRDFVVPACTESVCPLEHAGDAVPMACDGDMVEFQFALEHDPPIDIPTTDFAVYDEKNEFLTIYSLTEADSLVHLFIPVSATARQYRLCDLFNPEGCCVTVDLPGIDCNSVPTDVVDLEDLGVQLFPNPVSDRLQIDLAAETVLDGSYGYSIVSATGVTVASGLIDRRPVSVDMGALPAGIYMVGLRQGDVPLGYRRVVKVW